MTPRTATVTRPLHPLEGQTLVVLGKVRRHGHEELLVILEDGSKSLVPSAWTDLGGDGRGGSDSTEATATLGTLSAYRGLVFIFSDAKQIDNQDIPVRLIALSQGSPIPLPGMPGGRKCPRNLIAPRLRSI